MAEKREYLSKLLHRMKRWKFALAAAALGLVFLLWPTGEKRQEADKVPDASEAQETADADALAQAEKKLESLLSLIEGAGEVRVMLTLRSDGEWVYAGEKKISAEEGADVRRTQTETGYVVLRDGTGGERLVPVKREQAQYRGALIVCAGAGNASVRLALVEAVRAVTGLESSCITVAKMG